MCLGIPGKVVALLDEEAFSRMADVSFSGVKKTVSLAFVPEANVGDYVIVHAGFAITVLNEEEAAETLKYIERMGEASGES